LTLHSTKGIVFHSLKYSETSVIVKIYTELFGIQSYLIRGIRNRKSKTRPGLFQSLTLLDLVVYHREKQSLQSVKEVRLAFPYKTIPFDIRKSSVALFINELVYKAIREEETNGELFDFLWNACLDLDATEENIATFHLLFMARLMHYLGIFPQNNHSHALQVFNMREGLFQASVPEHPDYLDPLLSRKMHELLTACVVSGAGAQNAGAQNAGAQNFVPLLAPILVYYRLHLPGFRDMQSHHILHDVLA
jgi:DNA repair protein RecO (recombination protein O)